MAPNYPPPESDVWLPLPAEGETWDTHTVHTHYHTFNVGSRSTTVFIYVRYMPVLKIIQGGVCIHKGLNNLCFLDIEHCNFLNTMPWPATKNGSLLDNTVETPNGLRIEFVELGKKIRITYNSPDGKASFDVVQTAITPLLPRGFVMPGEDLNTNPSQSPGGSEQFMHCTGTLTMNGDVCEVDCFSPRDRSWRQVRTEAEMDFPPNCWSPIAFGEDLCFNQVGYESSPQQWNDALYTVDPSKSVAFFSWLVRNGEVRNVVKVRRDVTKFHPDLFVAVEQTITAEDEAGDTYEFKGEAVATALLPAWPNVAFIDYLYRWTDKQGRVTYTSYQETYYHKFNRWARDNLVANW